MLRLSFTTRDLARTRFAISPIWEVVASVRVLKAPGEHPVHLPWVDRVRPRIARARLDWRLLADLVPVPTRIIPAFTCPPPQIPAPDLNQELATLVNTSPDQVRASLDRLPGPRPPRLAALYDDPATGLARLAEVIRDYWAVALGPYWSQMRALLEGDVRARAHQVTVSGTQGVLNALDPSVRWADDSLFVAHRYVRGGTALGGRGLLLVPSVFAWPRVFSVTGPDYQPTLRYPPRGVGQLWTSGPGTAGGSGAGRPGADALAAVLGRSRALLLRELTEPATTVELARRTGLTPGGVSQHLTVLRAAGLVGAYREGRLVRYSRTAAAEALLAASASG